MDIQLTKDADKTLCEIYVNYLNRRADGIPKKVAKEFLNENEWPDPDWHTPDGKESLAELQRAGMIGQDILDGFWLKDEAIIYMENRFKNGLSEVLEYVGKLVSPISGIFS